MSREDCKLVGVSKDGGVYIPLLVFGREGLPFLLFSLPLCSCVGEALARLNMYHCARKFEP